MAGQKFAGSSQTFSVLAYGAKPDGVTDNGTAIRDAIRACKGARGGVVLLPTGVLATASTISLVSEKQILAISVMDTAFISEGPFAGAPQPAAVNGSSQVCGLQRSIRRAAIVPAL